MKWCLLVLLLLCQPDLSFQATIRCACRNAQPPFSMDDGAGSCKGYLIELMRQLGLRMNVELQFIPMNSSAVLKAIEKDVNNQTAADIALGFTSITPDRINSYDFSTSYLTTGYMLFLRDRITQNQLDFFSGGLSLVLGCLAILIVLTATCVYLLESVFGEYKKTATFKGLYDTLYNTANFVFSGENMFDTNSKTVKFVLTLSMIFAVVLSSFFTSIITTNLTVMSFQQLIEGPAQIPGETVVVVEGSAAKPKLTSKGVFVEEVVDFPSAVKEFYNRNPKWSHITAMVSTVPVIQDLKNQLGGGYTSQAFEELVVGLALVRGSPYLERINNALVSFKDTDDFTRLSNAWSITKAKSEADSGDPSKYVNQLLDTPTKVVGGVAVGVLAILLVVTFISFVVYFVKKYRKHSRFKEPKRHPLLSTVIELSGFDEEEDNITSASVSTINMPLNRSRAVSSPLSPSPISAFEVPLTTTVPESTQLNDEVTTSVTIHDKNYVISKEMAYTIELLCKQVQVLQNEPTDT